VDLVRLVALEKVEDDVLPAEQPGQPDDESVEPILKVNWRP